MDSNNSVQSPSTISVSNISWSAGSNGLLQAKNTTDQTVIDTINIVFDKSDTTGSGTVSGSTITITGGGKITSSRQPVLQLTSSQGIMLGSDGSGTIETDFSSANYATDDGTKSRTVILDFSGVSSGIALKGNILLGTGSATANAGWGNEESFIAKFGGEGMQGNITINKTGDGDGFKSKFIFSGDANLDGDLTLGENDRSEPNNTFIFDNGDILGTISTKASGSTTITYGQGNKTLATSLDIMAGTLTYKFADTVSSNKVFTLDASKASISGGKVVFDGVSQLVFKNGSSEGGTLTITPKVDSGKTYQNGSLVINLDSSAQANANNPIIKGSLSANKGGIFIGLKDPSGKTGVNPFTTPNAQLSSLDTYYVTGSVSITDGGISAFWNDSLGFYGKLSTPITASGNLIGKNDVWFSQAQSIKSIQATSGGTSHLVFDSRATLTGDSSIGIRSTQNNATQILFRDGADITGSITQVRNGYNNITFGANSSITGDIIANGNMSGNGGASEKIGNTIVFNNGGKITGNLSVTSGDGYSWGGYNLNAITFNGTEDATIEGAINATDGGSGRGNVINFNGSGTNKIVGNISTSPDSAGTSGRNYIVFGANSSSAVIKGSITVQGGINDIEFEGANGVIEGQVVANVSSGNNDGNKITFANGGSITGGVSVVENEASKTGYTLNTITFGGTNDATISGGITSNDGSEGRGNIINFNGTGTNRVSGGISAGVSAWGGAGRNAITFASGSTSSIDGNLVTTLGGVNIITFSGENGSITGNISATGNGYGGTKGGNQITFANGGSITGNISTNIDSATSSLAGYTQNQISFGGSNNATITGNILSLDGSAGKGNIINFNGSGLNKIIGNITASAGKLDNTNGRNIITFGASTQTAVIDGSITAENDAEFFTYAGGINQINTSSSLTVTGNIVVNRKGANNFDLQADGITLTLQGANSKITTLTALSTATNGNTLTLDATNNANVNATIDTLTNGNKLKVNFKGIDNTKSTRLAITTTNLISVDVESGAINTLALGGTGTTTIAEAVTVGANEGLTFDLGSGSSVTFGNNLTTNAQGIVSFNLGGARNTITGTLTNSGVNNFNLASGATTLQYGTEGLAFSSGENNINFKTGASTLNWKNSTGANFKNISTTGGITNFNLVDGADATIATGSTITTSGGTTNINFGEGTKLTVDSIATSGTGTTVLNFIGNGELAGTLNTSVGTTTINVGNNSSGANAVIAGIIGGNGRNHVVFGSGGQARSLTLKGANNTIASIDANNAGKLTLGNGTTKADTAVSSLTGSNLSVIYGSTVASNLTLKGANNTIASIDATNEGKLTLGKTSSAVNADVKAITTGEKLNVAFITDEANTLTLNVAESKLKSIDTTSGSGTINLVSGVGSLTVGSAPTAISVGTDNALNFTIADRTDALNLKNGIDATSGSSLITINDTGSNAVIAEGALTNVDVKFAGDTSSALTLQGTTNTLKSVKATNTSKLTLGNGTTKADTEIGTLTGSNLSVIYGSTVASNLTLKGANNTIASIDANNAGKLTLDATNGVVTTTISSEIKGSNLTVQFKGSSNGASTLNLNGGSLAIEINSGAIDENILSLQSGTTTVTGGINVESGEGITISLAENANLTSDLTNNENLDLNFLKDNILTGDINTTAGTTNINVKTGANGIITGEIKGSGATQATLEAGSTLNLVSNATLSKITMASSSTLDLSNPVGTHSDKNTSYSFDELSAGGANVVLYSEANKAKSRIDARGASASDKYYTLLKIGENGGRGLVGDNTTFTLHLDNAKYDNVYLGGVEQTGTPNNGDQYGYTYADRIVIENGSGDSGKIADIKLKIVPKLDELGEISYQGGGTETQGNIAVLTVKDGVTEKIESVQSVEVAGIQTQVSITSASTDANGNILGNGYTTYFAGEAKAVSISEGIKEIASTALTVNYDLFLANFNSLNKRMGELRDNAHNQGVWARVYGGAMSNDFGAGSKTEYVTAQGGYDYSLTLGDARNYMGIAIAYGHSSTKSNQIQNAISNVGSGQATGLQDVNSNMVEVGIYNSYVMDSGWYNDTILKFDYIMSSFTMTDNPSLESETNNFAMILSNEFGYRYKFGSDASWYIDPQLEVGFGYFNQSDFNRVIFDHINQQSADIKATQDTILTLRGRAGLSLGKKFTTDKGFASLYVGAFYEYDYIEGGNANASSFGVVNTIDSIESNGRAIVNVGSNIELTDGVRMYIDVEKSFGDKQRTDMQFNFGARYSFGEKTPTISYQEAQKKRVAPLKVEEKQEATTQESKTEAQANTEVKQEAKN